MSYSIDDLVRYRMQRSIEALEDADLLEARGRWNAAANRMYYACFYAISAFLIHKRIRATTHVGLKTMFNKEMVRTGIVSIHFRMINERVKRIVII